ncbi:MAG: hypothetical protein ACTHU0_28740 [Kofleriaceae bacterium]
MKKQQRRPTKRPQQRSQHRPRNAAPAVSRPRAPAIVRSSKSPDWSTIIAALAGGAGTAALGGLVVQQEILPPEAVGIGLMLGGSATAYYSEGTPRVVGLSVAGVGAGQFALALMNKRAVKAHDSASKNTTTAPAASPAPATPAQLAPPPSVATRQRASGGGVVVDLFRDAANDLEAIEDEWRYGIRDDAHPSAHDTSAPVVIDLDEAA